MDAAASAAVSDVAVRPDNARVNTPTSMCTPAGLAAFKRRLAKVDPILANVIRTAGKFTHTTSSQHSPFHSLARAIAHQQLNGTAAESIFGRFVGLYAAEGKEAALLEAELVLTTSDEKMRAVGLSFAKIASIKDRHPAPDEFLCQE